MKLRPEITILQKKLYSPCPLETFHQTIAVFQKENTTKWEVFNNKSLSQLNILEH